MKSTRTELVVPGTTTPGIGSFFTQAMWTVVDTAAARGPDGAEPLRISVNAGRAGFSLLDARGAPLQAKRRAGREHAVGDVRVWAINSDVVVVRGAGWETNVTAKPVYRHQALCKRGSNKSYVNRSAHEWRTHVLDVSVRPLDDTELA